MQQSSTFLRVWAGVLVAGSFLLGSLATFTFGMVCFAALFFLWFQSQAWEWPESLDLINGVMLFASFVWFVLNVLGEFNQSIGLLVTILCLALVFPPLIYHLFYLESRRDLESSYVWSALVWFFYAQSGGAILLTVLLFLQILTLEGLDLGALFSILMAYSFGTAGAASAWVMRRARKSSPSGPKKEVRKINIVLLVGMVFLFALFLYLQFFYEEPLTDFAERISYMMRSMPLIFLFFNSYYESRFDFFDVFVKRSTLFFMALAGLVLYFSLFNAYIPRDSFEPWLQPWVYALTLLPLVLALPWVSRRLEEWMDRTWLGRTFSGVEAVKYFLEGVQEVTDYDELKKAAESQLEEIFQAPTEVILTQDFHHLKGEPDFQVAETVRISGHGGLSGEIRMGRRRNDTPYFAQDQALLEALAEVLAYLLQILSLQKKKQEQEKRAQELTLHLSRSELKALRAQINPHFLFNALNAIASLTQRDADRAEETVEQLSEVFRYTLTKSEQEWARLQDELDFIESYLRVEQARFGKRLQVEVDVSDEAREQWIPSMVLQTLVENAVKHGISRVKGNGRIVIRSRLDDGRLELEVRDTGPGLVEQGKTSSSGYGLKNIVQRLEGYYGEEASFEVRRLEEEGVTVARLEVPGFSSPPARSAQERAK